MTPLEWRADVPALSEATYLNHGAHGPSPRYVVEAASAGLRDHEFASPATDDPYDWAFAEFEQTRERLASFLGVATDAVALTESTSAGIAAVADAFDWSAGDVVVRTDLEHPAGTLPWARLEREGVEVRVVETADGRVDRAAFAEAVADARLVCLSAVTWTHGTRLPVAELTEIAHDAGAFVLVDAVQVPGQLPLRPAEWGADAVAAAGHKWLLGVWGGGFLYVDPAAAAELSPRRVGYRGVTTPTADRPTFEPGARRFEVGSASPAPHRALREAVDAVEAVGVDRIRDRIDDLTRQFVAAVPDDRLLSPTPPESGLVSVRVSDPEATVDRLADDGIVVRSLPGRDAVRASIHAVNTATEVDRLAEALQPEW